MIETIMNRVFVLVLAAMVACSACADPVLPAAPTPVVPTITETFADTLLQFGTNSHQFAVQRVGGVKVNLTSIDPVTTVSVGIGTPSTATGQCLVLQTVTVSASTSAQLSGTATVTGTFCVAVSDVGNLV